MNKEKIYLIPSFFISFSILFLAGFLGGFFGQDNGVVREGIVPLFGASIIIAIILSLASYLLGLIAAGYKRMFKLPNEIIYVNLVLVYLSIILPLIIIAKEFYSPTVDGGFSVLIIPISFIFMPIVLLVSSVIAKISSS
jgi:flagellin-like protein